MPRNGSGTMSIVNSFSSNTTISSSDVNANFTDIAAEITGSLARDGQASMTGQFKAASGTATAPGICFSSDLDCGFYRIGANNFGISANGTLIADVDENGIDIASGKTLTKAGVPFECFAAGTDVLFYENTAPTGWTIVTTSTNDKALRVVSGSGAGGGTGGTMGGSTAFTSVFTSRTPAGTVGQTALAEGNLASHDHTLNSATSVVRDAGSGTSRGTGSASFSTSNLTVNDAGSDADHGHSWTGTAMDFSVAYVNCIICTKS